MSYCDFAPGHPFHGPYHDREYGFPVADDDALFERMVLEINQAGLSWLTILKKRKHFQHAFRGFDIGRVARMKPDRLLRDPGIIRNRLKIEAAVQNARLFLDIQKEFGSFDAYVWEFVGGRQIQNKWRSSKEVPTSTAEADALSKDLRRRGFKFVGPTICYAFMQAVGMVNDHLVHCFRHKELREKARLARIR